MDTKILGWDLAKIAELVKIVNNSQYKRKIDAFGEFANKYNVNVFSVRNFYYKLIDLSNNDLAVDRLLNKAKIQLQKTSHFDINGERELLFNLLRSDMGSVRNACFKLSNGDKKGAIRLQNKYRNLLKNKPQMVQEVCCKLRKNNIKTRLDAEQDLGNNILLIPEQKINKKSITKEDIEALFLGLVRLVKNSVYEEEFDRQNVLKKELEKTTIELKRKDILLQELREQNEAINTKLNIYKERLQTSQDKNIQQYKKVQDLLKSNKMEQLREFVENLAYNQQNIGKKR